MELSDELMRRYLEATKRWESERLVHDIPTPTGITTPPLRVPGRFDCEKRQQRQPAPIPCFNSTLDIAIERHKKKPDIQTTFFNNLKPEGMQDQAYADFQSIADNVQKWQR